MGAFENDILVGMLGFFRESKTNQTHNGFIWDMFVDLKKQNLGIGKKLLELSVEKGFQITGVTQINLTVFSTNKKAKSFYEKFGFEIYGSEKKIFLNGSYFDYCLIIKFLL